MNNDLKRRQNLESELAKWIDVLLTLEAGSKLSDDELSRLSNLIDKKKHEIEQELIMLPESDIVESDEYDLSTANLK